MIGTGLKSGACQVCGYKDGAYGLEELTPGKHCNIAERPW